MKRFLKTLTLAFFTGTLISSLHAQVYTEYFLKAADYYKNLTPTAVIGGGDGSILATGHYVKVKGGENLEATIPFICKFNTVGGLEWFYDYHHNDETFPALDLKPVAITTSYPGQAIVIAGNVFEGGQHKHPFVIKVNPDGYHEFTKFYGCIENREDEFLVHCTSFYINDMIGNLMGGVVLAGHSKLFDESGNRIGIVLQLDHWGEYFPGNVKTFTQPGYEDTEVKAIRSMAYGDFAVLLSSTQPTDPTSWWVRPSLVKVNNQFQTIWARQIYRDYYYDSYAPYGLQVTSDQRIMILGELGANLYLTFITTGGYETWTQKYNYTDTPDELSWSLHPPSLEKDSWDNFYIAQNVSHVNLDSIHTRVIKTDPYGNVIWGKRYGAPQDDNLFEDIAIINNPPFTIPAQDMVLIGRHSGLEGETISAEGWKVRARIGDGSTDCNHATVSIEDVRLGFSGESYEPGYYDITPTLSYHLVSRNDPGTTLEQCNGFNPQFNPQPLAPQSLTQGVAVYPNPNSGSFTISISEEGISFPSAIMVYDVAGSLVYQKVLENSKGEIQLSGLDKGIYLVKWVQGTATKVEKVIVQD